MSEGSFKDFIKKLQRYPVLYKEDQSHPNNAIPPILSFIKGSPAHPTIVVQSDQTQVDDSSGIVKIKLMNGEIKEFPASGTLSSLKSLLKDKIASQNENIR